MKQLTVIAGVLVCFLGVTAHAQNRLPEAVAQIEQFKSDPVALVDAARRYQDQQLELIRWDTGLIQVHRNEKDRGSAEAKRAAAQQRIDTVKLVWGYVNSLYPNDPRALNYTGEFWFDVSGDQMTAITYWRRSSMLDTRYGLADNNLGIYYFHIGNYARGLEHLNKALELDPDNPDYLFNIAQMYLNHFPQIAELLDKDKKKLYRDAMGYSKKAMENAPEDFELAQDYAVNFFAAENLGVEADWQQAAKAWAHARELAPDKDEHYFSLLNEARCWIYDGKGEKALPLLEEALKVTPDSEAVQNLITEARGGAATE